METPVFAEALQEDPEDAVPGPTPRPLGASPKDRTLLAERQISQRSSTTEEAAKNEGKGPHKGHRYLPLNLSGLVELDLR